MEVYSSKQKSVCKHNSVEIYKWLLGKQQVEFDRNESKFMQTFEPASTFFFFYKLQETFLTSLRYLSKLSVPAAESFCSHPENFQAWDAQLSNINWGVRSVQSLLLIDVY